MRRTSLLASLLFLLPVLDARAQAPIYTVEALGAASAITDMNNSGQIVGWTSGATYRAWIAGPGRPVELLPLPPGKTSSWANAMQGFSNGTVLPFRDGILCAGPPVLRLQAIMTSASGAGATSVSLAQAGGVQPGQSWVYQVWFRDQAGPCGTESNLSSAVRVDWR